MTRLLGFPIYLWYVITGKKAAVVRQLKAYGATDLEEVRRENGKRIDPNFDELKDTSDFATVAGFLADRLHFMSVDFVQIFQSGNAFYDWILRVGVYVGDFVIRHSANEARWVKDADGLWVVEFARDAGPHQWSPFEFVSRRYFFNDPEDLVLALDILRKLKC